MVSIRSLITKKSTRRTKHSTKTHPAHDKRIKLCNANSRKNKFLTNYSFLFLLHPLPLLSLPRCEEASPLPPLIDILDSPAGGDKDGKHQFYNAANLTPTYSLATASVAATTGKTLPTSTGA